MSDFLSREQELMKINEELNKKTQEVLKEGSEQSPPPSLSSSGSKSSLQSLNMNQSPKVESPGDSRRSSLIVENDSSRRSSRGTSASIKSAPPVIRRDSKIQVTEKTFNNSRATASSKIQTMKRDSTVVHQESLSHNSPPNSRAVSPTTVSTRKFSVTRRESVYQFNQTPPNSRTISPKSPITATAKRDSFARRNSISIERKSPENSRRTSKGSVKGISQSKADNKTLSSVIEEKSSGKSKLSTYSSKAYTVPRYSRTATTKVTSKERELYSINAKIDKKAKAALEDVKENINKTSTKTTSKAKPIKNRPMSGVVSLTPRNPMKSPKRNNLTTTNIEKRSPGSSGKTSPSSIPIKKESQPLMETYKNKNFVESPSTEALSLELNHDGTTSITSEKQLDSLPSQTADNSLKSKKGTITTSSTKKSIKQPFPMIVNKKNVTSDGLIKYLKSKLSVIEVELEDNVKDLKQKVRELHDYSEANKKLEAQRNQAVAKNISLTEQLTKTEDKLAATEKKLKDRESELAATTCEMENAKRELRVVNQVNNNLEKKLYIANEELENMKNSFASFKEMEREQKEATRREQETVEKQLKALKKQRSELLGAYKKQLYLIDNLRRQNICMEQARMVSFGEKEFAKVLAWDSHNFA